MDPITAPTLVLEAWKVGGIVGALLAIIGLIVWLGWKDSKSREKESQAREARMADALNNCQAEHVKIASSFATCSAQSSAAINRNSDVNEALLAVLRDRPCLKDPTPARGSHVHFPTPRPPSDHRR